MLATALTILRKNCKFFMHHLHTPNHAHGVLGQANEKRCNRKDRHADLQHTPTSIQIAQPATEQEQSAKGENIRIDHPRQVRCRDSEVILECWQRNICDRIVKHHHELGGGDNGQGQTEWALWSA